MMDSYENKDIKSNEISSSTSAGENTEEKTSDSSLSVDEFSFKPKLEVMSEAANGDMRVQIPEEKPSPTDMVQEDSASTPLQRSQPATFIGEYLNPSAPKLKSNASVDVRQHMLMKYYALRPGIFERALDDIRQYLKPTIDGNFLSGWLMAEIDHWDHEKERIAIITDTQLILIKYNFVASRIDDCRRIQHHRIDRVQGGRFQYPEKTMMMPRAYQTGIRISWNKNEVLTRWQRFSPFFNSPSYVTFTQHKAAFHLDVLPSYMAYENFKAALVNAVQEAGAIFEVVIEPIFIEVYVGAISVVHNSSDLGYSKDRGAASF